MGYIIDVSRINYGLHDCSIKKPIRYMIVISRINYGLHDCHIQDKLWATILMFSGQTMGFMIVVSRKKL